MSALMALLRKWHCDDCDTKIVVEKQKGTAMVHCNCQSIQAIRISLIKLKDDEYGEDSLMFVKHQKKFKPNPQVDQIPTNLRGLNPDYDRKQHLKRLEGRKIA